MSTQEIHNKLRLSVIDGDPEEAAAAAALVIENSLDPIEAIEKGLSSGLNAVGEGFGDGELFLMDLMGAAEAMKAGIEVLQPELEKQKQQVEIQGKVVIGTVSGDIHDIGKSITSSMLYANGFDTIDLGVDVPTATFIENVKKHKPDVIGLSALMSTTMKAQKEVIEALKKAGLRDKVKVIIGGAIVNQTWADEIGADDWSKDALEAVDKVKQLVKS